MLNNALIIGGHGMVGKNITFGIKPTSIELDITNKNSINMFFQKNTSFSCIINLVATNIRESEENPSKSINVNINGNVELLSIAMKYDIPFIYVSTGAVFSSNNTNVSFDEDAIPNPNCMYGNTKYSAEKISLLYNKTILIRTGWLFGGHQKTHYKFVETTINNLLTDTIINASNNFVGSPTYVIDFIEQMKYLINGFKYGIHHVVNSGNACGFDIAIEIANNMNKSHELIKSLSCDMIPNSGPYRSCTEVLDTKYDYNNMRHWKEALEEYVNSYRNHLFTRIDNIIVPPVKKWSNRTLCRLCNNNSLYVFFKLEPTPPANHFLLKREFQDVIPLDICICETCHHIQLSQIVCPTYQYSNYLYVSSTSQTMKTHLQTNVLDFMKILKLNKTDNILEIGANDGLCIQHLLDNGYTNIVGVDPAKNINIRHSLPIICDFFGSNILQTLKTKYNSFKLIYAFHCCAHIENIQDVFNTIYNLLDDDGVFIMEVGYFYEVFKNNLFDVIYHEHIDYHTCTAIDIFSKKHNLLLYRVRENNIQGGSIQFFFTKNVLHPIDTSVYNCIDKEKKLDLFDIPNLNNWKKIVIQNGKDINYIINSLVSNGKKIIGYGAPAKLTTFMYQYKLSNTCIQFIIDDNTHKHNLYTPGKHILIQPIDILHIEQVDYIIIFSWNFTNEIINKLDVYRKNGVRIIIPFPEIKII